MNEKIITLKNLEKIAEWIKSKFENKANKDEIPTSLPADGGNADTVGGKSAEELIQSNPNLLLNPDFKVNQRGKSEYGYDGSDRYTVDRWKLQANLTLTVHNDYVTVSRHDPTSNSHTGFRQELNIPDDTSVTLQACVKGNGSFTLFHNGFSGTAEMQVQDTDGWVVVKCTGYGASDAGVLLRGTATSLDIKWIKLELGAVSTPFVPPDYLEEALKCGSLENAEQQIFYGDGVWANAPSNPNLLDNPDFKINQRGQTEYRGLTYTVDRWKKTTAGIVTIDSDGVFLNNTNDTTAMYWGQTLLLDLASKTVSLSACDSNGNIYYLSGVAPKESKNPLKLLISDIGSFYVDLNVDHYEFFFQIKPGKSIKIKWAKLEYGSVATPFVPPNPTTELLKCQRYYQRLGGIMRHIGSGFITGTAAAIVCPLATTMRVTGPTITINGTMYIWTKGRSGSNALQATELASNHSVSNTTLNLPIKTDNDSSLDGCGATLQFRDTESYIALSADL
jgi:hypothetical protein